MSCFYTDFTFALRVSGIRQNVPCSVTDDRPPAISLFTMKSIALGATEWYLLRRGVEIRTSQGSSHTSWLLLLVRRNGTPAASTLIRQHAMRTQV
jgi:hypothetical protein